MAGRSSAGLGGCKVRTGALPGSWAGQMCFGGFLEQQRGVRCRSSPFGRPCFEQTRHCVFNTQSLMTRLYCVSGHGNDISKLSWSLSKFTSSVEDFVRAEQGICSANLGSLEHDSWGTTLGFPKRLCRIRGAHPRGFPAGSAHPGQGSQPSLFFANKSDSS